jgi:hypothetical protein
MRLFCVAAIAASLLWATPSAAQQTFTVSGKVLTSSGEPLRGKDLFILIGHDEGNGFVSASSRIEEDGTFQFHLVPGRYLLSAAPSQDPGGFTPPDERGFVAVTVLRADVASVVIRTRPPVRVRGHIRYDAEMANATRPDINLFASPALDGLGIGGGVESTSRVAADGSFELLIAAGPVVIRNGYSPRADSMWWPGPVLLEGQDITDVPTDFSKTNGELEVVFTQRPIGVFGIVTEEATQLPAENASVVVFSAEPTQRQPWAEASKFIQADENGRFWGTLSAGKYLAVAFPAGTIDSRTTAFRNLESFVKLATPFTIDPERRGARVRLTLSRPPLIRR